MQQNKYIYGDDFYDTQVEKSLESANEVVPSVLSYVKPKSVLDVGCGVGTWLSVFRENGIEDVFGIDGDYVNTERLLIPKEKFLSRNLAEDAALSKRFDLVVSLEVAEHLPASSAKNFVAALTSMSDVVLFSAAIPGQGGFHHINEQWQSYWRDLFAERDFTPVDCLRPKFWNNKKIQVCYKQNIFFYAAKESLEKFQALMREKSNENPGLFDVVHPDMFETIRDQPPTLREIIKTAPDALRETVTQRTAKLLGKK